MHTGSLTFVITAEGFSGISSASNCNYFLFSYFLIAETYLINRWHNPNIVGKQHYIHCSKMLFTQTIPASLQYTFLITLYTIHILVDVLIQEQGSKRYPYQNWSAKHNKQKKKDNLIKNTQARASEKVTRNQLPWDSNGHRAFHLYFINFNLTKVSSDK